MNRRWIALPICAFAAGTIGLAGPASAGSPAKTISGAFQEIGPDNFLRVNPTSDNVSVTVDVHPIVFTGGLLGTAQSTEHTVGRKNFTFETHNIEAFDNVTVTADDGTVIGTGPLTVNFNATGYFTVDDFGNVGGAFTGTFEFVGGGGGLSGLRGRGTVTGVPGSTSGYGTYTGSVHF